LGVGSWKASGNSSGDCSLYFCIKAVIVVSFGSKGRHESEISK
jgi:hypothetical protein